MYLHIYFTIWGLKSLLYSIYVFSQTPEFNICILLSYSLYLVCDTDCCISLEKPLSVINNTSLYTYTHTSTVSGELSKSLCVWINDMSVVCKVRVYYLLPAWDACVARAVLNDIVMLDWVTMAVQMWRKVLLLQIMATDLFSKGQEMAP